MGHFFKARTGAIYVHDPRECGADARKLADDVLADCGVSFEQILERKRSLKLDAARCAVVAALWETGRHSKWAIARFLGRTQPTINVILNGRQRPCESQERRAA